MKYPTETRNPSRSLARSRALSALPIARFLLNLKLVNLRGQFGQNLICPFVVFKLGRDQVGKITEGFRGVEDLGMSAKHRDSLSPVTHILHDTLCLFHLTHKIIFFGLNLGPGIFT